MLKPKREKHIECTSAIPSQKKREVLRSVNREESKLHKLLALRGHFIGLHFFFKFKGNF
jgi:hypothetical protein